MFWRLGMQLLPQARHKQELDALKLHPRPFSAKPATIPSFFSFLSSAAAELTSPLFHFVVVYRCS